EAEHAKSLALDVHPERVLPEHAGFHPGVLPADPPGELEDQTEGDASVRIAEAAGAADHDAALLTGLHVDRGVVSTGGDEELELRHAVDHRARKSRALTHHHDDVEVLEVADGVCVAPAHRLGEHLDIDVLRHLRPVGEIERHVLVVVDDRAAIGHVSTPCALRSDGTLEHDAETWEPAFAEDHAKASKIVGRGNGYRAALR